MSLERTGFTTITYRFRLYEKHFSWFERTKELYNRVVAHFYAILKEQPELLALSGHELLRELERLTIGTKEMKAAGAEIRYPLAGFPKIPLYFRRAAINAAAGLMRSYVSRHKRWEVLPESRKQKEGEPSHPSQFMISPVYYKGMYREWQESSVELKLYDGEAWRWERFRYKGRRLPEGAVCQSPTIVVGKAAVMLHVPVTLPVKDTRTVRERMEREACIFAVAFPDQDVLAAGVVLDRAGRTLEEKTFRGGKAREEQRRKLLERLEKSRESRGFPKQAERKSDMPPAWENTECPEASGRENAALYAKLSEINRYYAHQISSEIVNYCLKQQLKVIIVPDYGNAIDFSEKRYLRTNMFRWQGRAIISNLRYKAYKEGIVVTAVSSKHISDRCSVCGAEIKKYNEGHHAGRNYYGGKLFVCPNGHQGNSAVNTAENVGRYFLREYPQEL